MLGIANRYDDVLFRSEDQVGKSEMRADECVPMNLQKIQLQVQFCSGCRYVFGEMF